MKDKREVALSFVRINGPILPVRISKAIDTNILMASAILSELVSEKKVMLTNMSIGTSPLYYVSGQEYKLQVLEKHISGRIKDAYYLLKGKRVLRDDQLEPAIRVALRELKDFAKPLQVKVNNDSILFWKWYLLNNDQAGNIIKGFFDVPKPTEKIPLPVEEKKEGIKPATLDDKVKPKEVLVKEDIKPTVKDVEDKEAEPKQEEVKEIVSFYKAVDDYFRENKVNILNEEIVRRDREFNFIVEIPSKLGNLRYFVKVKNKKKIQDGDLTTAYNQANMEHLPLLFLTNGELVKKSKDLLDKGLKGIVFKKF